MLIRPVMSKCMKHSAAAAAHLSRCHSPGVRTALALSVALSLGGCTSMAEWVAGDKVDYRNRAGKTAPLEVPPDLSQLARDGRYRVPGGTVSASAVATGTAAGAPTAGAGPVVALTSVGQVTVERRGAQRWLVVPTSPDQLWPQLRTFWKDRGVELEVDSPQVGVMETAWTENRAKMPNDPIRNLLGRVFDSAYSSGVRDRFRTRVERVGNQTEIYITHRRMEETAPDLRDPVSRWVVKPSDPDLEAEILSRLMVALGTPQDQARQKVAQAAESPGLARMEAPARGAAPVFPAPQASSLTVDDGFERAWRRVGLALDRSGFTVEDRDRAAGLFYVRYVDPNNLPRDDISLLQKLFGGDKAGQTVRYRVLVRSEGDNRSTVVVQNSQGQTDTGEAARRILSLLQQQLR